MKKSDNWKNITFVFSAFILGLFPLLTGNSKYSDITFFKFRTFRTSAYVYLIISFLILIYVIAQKKKLKPALSLPQVFIILYAVLAFVSALSSSFTFKECWAGFGRHEGLCSLLLYASIFYIVSMSGERNDSYSLIISVSVLIFDLIGVLQLFVKGVIFPKGYYYWNTNFMSTMGNIDMVGGYVALFLPFIFSYYVIRGGHEILHLPAVGFLTFLFAITNVDSGKMGLLAAFTLTVVFLIDTKEKFKRFCYMSASFVGGYFLKYFLNINGEGIHFTLGAKTLVLLFMILGLVAATKIKLNIEWNSKKIRKVTWIALGCAIVVALVFLYNYKGSHILLHDMSEVLHFRLPDKAGSGRGYLWKSAMSLVKNHPLIGHGPGTFGEVYKHLDRFTTYTDAAHNDFIQIAVCLGYGGALIYCAFCATLLGRAFIKIKDDPYMTVYFASCLSYLVHTFFSFSIAFLSPQFWVMAGLMEYSTRQKNAKIRN